VSLTTRLLLPQNPKRLSGPTCPGTKGCRGAQHLKSLFSACGECGTCNEARWPTREGSSPDSQERHLSHRISARGTGDKLRLHPSESPASSNRKQQATRNSLQGFKELTHTCRSVLKTLSWKPDTIPPGLLPPFFFPLPLSPAEGETTAPAKTF